MKDEFLDPLRCEFNIKLSGYENGLRAVADFIDSGKSFVEWYRDGPSEICSEWLYLLKALGKEEDFYVLQDILDKERNQNE